jgi:eukaryotic-like serine/threonine-protein kinase
MSDRSHPDWSELPLDVLDQIDRICDRFEAAWKSGQRPRVEDYDGEIAEPHHRALLRDLLAAELDARHRRGEWPSFAEYTLKHPELADEIGSLVRALVVFEQDQSFARSTRAKREGKAVAGPGRTPRQLGDYLILRQIGRGGMGVVYESVQQSLGRHVALKVLPPQALADSSQLARFRLEARAAARLQHTNIVPVFGVGECEGVHYYAMQFIAGQGLDVVIDAMRRLRDGAAPARDARECRGPESTSDDRPSATILTELLLSGPLTSSPRYPEPRPEPVVDATKLDAAGASLSRLGLGEGRAKGSRTSQITAGTLLSVVQRDTRYYRSVARVGIQVAEALAHAHAQGILHRDIKPSNLLLDAKGTVWVTDFGLAKTDGRDGLTQTGDILGTLRYMAPERFEGWADPRSDIYGLGATLYELLTLRPPFQDANRVKLIEQVLHQSPAPPRQIERSIPRDLETIVLRSLAREPRLRYTTARALAEDLSLFLEGRPIRARPVSASERAWRWGKRNPWLAGLTSALFLALLSGTVVATFFAARATHQARNADLQSRRANHESGRATRLANELKTSLDRSNQLTLEREKSLKASNRILAALYFERGHATCTRGNVGVGLLRLVECYYAAIAAGDQGWRHTALASLSAWQRHCVKLRAVFSHAKGVNSVAFSPDGRTVLTGSWDLTARLWDASTGQPIGLPIAYHSTDRAIMAFSPDGKTIAAASTDKTARLWDASTGRAAGLPLTHRDWVTAVAFSPDGKTVLTGSLDKTARLWDAATCKPIGIPLVHQGSVQAVAFSPDGKSLVTGSDDMSARLWDATTGKPLGIHLLHQGLVDFVSFSPDGRTVLTGSADKTVRFWEATTGRAIGRPAVHQDIVTGVAFSPDGKTVLTGSADRTARLWEAKTGNPLGLPMMHQGLVRAVAFSPDGKTALTGSYDTTARMWDANTGEPVGVPLVHQGNVRDVKFSPDGKTFLIASGDKTARLWDAPDGNPDRLRFLHQSAVHAVAFSPDGKTVLTGCSDKTARLWDAATGVPLGLSLMHQSSVSAIAFSPDAKTVLTGSGDSVARLWDVSRGEPRGQPMPHGGEVLAVAFSPDGKRVLTGCADKSARLWAASTGRPLGSPMTHKDRVYAVAFSPDGRTVLTGSQDKTARMWSVSTGDAFGRPMTHQNGVYAVAFSPDARTVLTASWDKTARLWDALTGQPLGVPPLKHQDGVYAAAFSPNGKTVLTGSDDGTARLWDTMTGQPLGPPLSHGSRVSAVVFSPDGKAALTGSFDGAARLWDISELPDDEERIATWVEVFTGLGLEEMGSVKVLDNSTWRQRRDKLQSLGDKPATARR